MSKLDQFVQSYLTAAKANPGQRFEIFRGAAYDLMNLAQNPKNAKAAAKLSEMGLMFARAASDTKPSGATVEDFKDLLQETAQAYQDVGEDPMDLIARRRQIHDERTQATPGNVSIAPESFNKDATLGRSQKIKWNPSQDEVAQEGVLQNQTVAFWQGTKKEAQAMTVDVSLGFLPTLIVDTDTPFDTIDNRAFAEVEFGSDGNRNKVVLDLGTGRRLTVVGNYISVNVGMDQPRAGYSSQIILAGASIGAFAAPSRAPVIRTVYIDDLTDNNSSPWIPIPLKAVELLPIVLSAPDLGNISLYFADAGGNQIANYRYNLVLPQTLREPIALPGDAAYVSVDNFTGSTIQVRLPFELAL